MLLLSLFLLAGVFAVWYWRTGPPGKPATGNGKTVLVTGAASGVGRCVALRLNELGYRVVAGDVNQTGLDELKASHSSIETVSLNVANPSSVDEVAARLSKTGMYAVVNVAGISNPQPVLTCSEEQMKKVFEVNTFGPVRVVRSLYPLLRASKGMVINVTSVSGKCAWPWQGFYAASKFALEGFSDLLRREIGRFGVRTVVIEPGPIMTPMIKEIKSGQLQWLAENPESEYHKILTEGQRAQDQSMGAWEWMAVRPEQVAETIAVALGTTNPAPRYVVATRLFWVVFHFMIFLPDHLADICMAKMMG